MGKKKDKANKAKGPRMPKHIAGVKVPKALRHKGEALVAKAASPEGRAAIAKGLTAAAAIANLVVERGRTAGTPEPARDQPDGANAPPPRAARDPANDAAPLDPQKVAETVSTVADAVLGRLFPKR